MERKSIYQLLQNHKLVVPEIQREYVWGSYKQVLAGFIADLGNKLAKGEANVGFLYSYTKGKENYLIDGQQRFTTVLLLLYVLATGKDTDNERFKHLLRLHDKQPAFSYRVRSNTVLFMKNLFESRICDVAEIREQKWYKSCYNDDMSIQAMISALKELSAIRELIPFTFDKVLTQVSFWYFDVDRTSQGEELYITMNSRGEKLTDSEQIKPRLFDKIKVSAEKERYGKEWDNWEELFYNPHLRDNRGIKAVDVAMNNFVRVVLELKTMHEHNIIKPVDDARFISLPDIKRYMDAVNYILLLQCPLYDKEIKRLYGDSKSDANFFVLKALLTERIKGQTDLREYERVYRVIRNQVRRNKIKEHTSLLTFLHNYSISKKSFYEFVLEEGQIINGHELDKVKIYAEYGEPAENAMWQAQETNFWDGNIKPLVTWAMSDGVFSVEDFNRIRTNFQLFSNEKQTEGCTDDVVRRALLCLDLNDYPINGTHFGYSHNEWIGLFNDNAAEIKNFITRYDNADYGDVSEYCCGIIKCNNSLRPWAEFVAEPYLLEYLDTKHVYWDDNCGFQLVKRQWAQPLSVKNMHIYHELLKKCRYLDSEGGVWHIWPWINWNSCIAIDCKSHNFAIDIRYRRNKPGERYNMQLFRREVDSDAVRSGLSNMAQVFGFTFDDGIGRYMLDLEFDDQKVEELINQIYTYCTRNL